jgi:putative regulatory protein
MSTKQEEKLPETASELREYLNKKNSQTRAARRKLKEVEKADLLSAKKALGEAVAGAVFADNTDAILALVQVVNKPEIADALRRVLGVKNAENDASEETEDEAQWASAEGDDQDGTSAPQVQW